jgi:hypothetical protein
VTLIVFCKERCALETSTQNISESLGHVFKQIRFPGNYGKQAPKLAGTPWPMRATTRGASRIGAATDRSSTPRTRYTQLSAAPFKDFWR